MNKQDILVIGASAGGVDALKRLVRQFPPDFEAAVFIVLHTSPESPGLLADILDRAGDLTARFAKDGEEIQKGRICVAPSNQHLLVKRGYVRLSAGPRENRSRPAIDPLFRSAAASYSTRVVGVVLTGMLDDGTSGLIAIKKCGGTAIVQDVEDAQYPDMPQSAIHFVDVDHIVPVDSMGAVLAQVVNQTAKENGEVPKEVLLEAKISEKVMSDIPTEERIGELVPFGCTECGGPLWKIETDEVRRFRCHVGHGFTSKSLLADQDEAIERALWAAMRAMEERANIVSAVANDENERGRSKSAEMYARRANESKEHAKVLRQLLIEDA